MTTGLPLKMLQQFQQVRGPALVNWPSDNSRKKMGMPTKNNMMTYGMKKIAEKVKNGMYWYV